MAQSAESRIRFSPCIVGIVVVADRVPMILAYWTTSFAGTETQNQKGDVGLGSVEILWTLRTVVLYYAFTYDREEIGG